MEPQRGVPPKKGFLETIRKVADEIGAVLIFDEVTSGFHNNLGGIHLELGIKPDLAIFAKAMGNGFPISAVIGKKEVMDVAQDTESNAATPNLWLAQTAPRSVSNVCRKYF